MHKTLGLLSQISSLPNLKFKLILSLFLLSVSVRDTSRTICLVTFYNSGIGGSDPGLECKDTS